MVLSNVCGLIPTSYALINFLTVLAVFAGTQGGVLCLADGSTAEAPAAGGCGGGLPQGAAGHLLRVVAEGCGVVIEHRHAGVSWSWGREMSLDGGARLHFKVIPEELSRGSSGAVGPQTSPAEEKQGNPVGESGISYQDNFLLVHMFGRSPDPPYTRI